MQKQETLCYFPLKYAIYQKKQPGQISWKRQQPLSLTLPAWLICTVVESPSSISLELC